MTKKNKPKIEDFAKDLLDNDKLRNLVCFNEFLNENELTAAKTSKYFWSVRHEGIRICTIAFYRNHWWIRCLGRYHGSDELLNHCEKYLSKELKNLIQNNIVTNLPCKNCNSFESKLVFGKMFNRYAGVHRFVSPIQIMIFLHTQKRMF